MICGNLACGCIACCQPVTLIIWQRIYSMFAVLGQASPTKVHNTHDWPNGGRSKKHQFHPNTPPNSLRTAVASTIDCRSIKLHRSPEYNTQTSRSNYPYPRHLRFEHSPLCVRIIHASHTPNTHPAAHALSAHTTHSKPTHDAADTHRHRTGPFPIIFYRMLFAVRNK